MTILIFRWVRQAWDVVQLLVPGVNSLIPKPAPVLTHVRPQQHQQQQQLGALAENKVAPEGDQTRVAVISVCEHYAMAPQDKQFIM